VIAAIGLSVGVLNQATYAIVVLIAILTTVMAAPTLKACVDRAGPEARRVSSSSPPGSRRREEGRSDSAA
jgi:hypothetical protein